MKQIRFGVRVVLAVLAIAGVGVSACDGPTQQQGDILGVITHANLVAFEFTMTGHPELEIDCNTKGLAVTVDPTQPLTMSCFSDEGAAGYFEPFDFNQCPALSFGPFPVSPFAAYGQGGATTFDLSPEEVQNLIDMTDQFGGVLFGIESVACDLDAFVIPVYFSPPIPPPSVVVTKSCMGLDEVFMGQPVRFEIEVVHVAGGVAEDVVVTDTLPIEFDIDELNIHSDITGAVCTRNGRTLTCQLGDVGPGFVGKIWITTRAVSAAVISNSATATAMNFVNFDFSQAGCGFEILDLNVMTCPEFVLLEPGNSLRCESSMDPVVLEAIPSGGTPPYRYLWLPPIGGGTSSSIAVTPSQSQVYSVTVTDFLGCQVTKDAVVLVATAMEAAALWQNSGPEFLPDQNRDGNRDMRDLVLFMNQCSM